MTRNAQIDPPVWISDHEDIRNLLSIFLDKIDKDIRLLLRLTSKNVPSLFDYNNPDSGLTWKLIQMLETDFNILTIELEREKPDKEIYDNAKIRFNPDSESLVRNWLHRPRRLPYKEKWRLSVETLEWSNSANTTYIAGAPLSYIDKTAAEVAAQLQAIESSLAGPLTLRALSATLFWGDSKYLDNRQEYLKSAFPHLSDNIQVRPVLVNAHIPENYSSVLFVENQDTYLMLVTQLRAMASAENYVETIAIIYTAGYRGTATRIRNKSNYIFSLVSQPSSESIHRFTKWWELQSSEQLPTFFWGDLDYAGLGILSSLREIFAGTTAWRPGYDLMIKHHERGLSHPMTSVNKGIQSDPGLTGCTYSDEILKSVICSNNQFVDQEVVTFDELKSHINKNHGHGHL